jgi:undecaprenyl diphosphate synthase
METSPNKLLTWPPPESAGWADAERELLGRISPADLPRHVAVIMDGNGRWARRRGLIDRIRGHEAGIESVREITRTCAQLRLEALTLYAFSKENWQRPRTEILALMGLLERFLVAERGELMDNNIRLRAIGSLPDLPSKAREELNQTISMTRENAGMTLTLALSYGGRDEIIRAIRRLTIDARDGTLNPETIDETAFSRMLDTGGLPDPDLLIRTSGEFRISNFLLWQIAYAEIHVTSVLWPDFRREHLLQALIDFKNRERRFGRLSDPDPEPRAERA